MTIPCDIEGAAIEAVLSRGSGVTLEDAWSLLLRAERLAALQRLLDGASSNDRARYRQLRHSLARAVFASMRGFRLATILDWPNERLLREAARLERLGSGELTRGAIFQHNQPHFPTLQARFFDLLGLEHEQGTMRGVLSQHPGRSNAEIQRAALALWEKEPKRQTAIYLISLVGYDDYWRAIGDVLPQFRLGDSAAGSLLSGPSTTVRPLSGSTENSPDSADEDVEGTQTKGAASSSTPADSFAASTEPPAVSPDDVILLRRRPSPGEVDLTPLDDLLIINAVACEQKVVGAPDQRRLRNIINELVRLNSTRHQSYFHLGFHHGLSGLNPQLRLPAGNLSRQRWYFAGFVTALGRQPWPMEAVASHADLDLFEQVTQTDRVRLPSAADINSVLDLYDRSEVVRGLGDTGRGPSKLAAPVIVDALIRSNQIPKLVTFVTVECLRRQHAILDRLVQFGTELQRQEMYDSAMPIFELLWGSRSDEPPDEQRDAAIEWRTIQRRFANCLRAGGKLDAAREMLEDLLDEDAETGDETARAMVLADLGLIESGFGRLAALRLPATDETRTAMISGLKQGKAWFEESERLSASTSSHGRYALGMLALVGQEYAQAETYLESAMAAFDLERERYEPAGLLRRARIHLALARCANPDSNANKIDDEIDILAAHDVTADDLPVRFAVDAVLGVEARGHAGGDKLVERLLDTVSEPFLDALIAEGLAPKSPQIATRLVDRFHRRRRTPSERVADGHRAFRILLALGSFNEAEDLLDDLEGLALDGIGAGQFADLLAMDDRLGCIWSVSDILQARARVLKSLGRFDEVAKLLVGEFYRILASRAVDAFQRGHDLLESLKAMPSSNVADLSALESQLERCGLAAPALPKRPPNGPVRVLVVGGDERQARYDRNIIEDYRSSAPWLDVEFLHTGFASNWDKYVDDFKRRLPDSDAVVMIYLMRTEFGRTIRRLCNGTPWRGCGGSGKRSIECAIESAVEAVVAGGS